METELPSNVEKPVFLGNRRGSHKRQWVEIVVKGKSSQAGHPGKQKDLYTGVSHKRPRD